MIESPYLQGILQEMLAEREAEWLQQHEAEWAAQREAEMAKGRLAVAQTSFLSVLEARFGSVPGDLEQRVRAVEDIEKLQGFLKEAVQAADLDAFRQQLEAE